MNELEELRQHFESLARCSYGFKRSRKGNYVNPSTARDWKWFRMGWGDWLAKNKPPPVVP